MTNFEYRFRRCVQISCAILLGIGITAADAGVLIGGPLAGGAGASGGRAACRLFNASSFSVAIVSKQIFSNSSATALGLASDDCGASLAAGKSCKFDVLTTTSNQYVCKVVTSTDFAIVTGAIDITKSDTSVIEVLPMVKMY